MRILYIAIVIVIFAIVILFNIQNVESVNVSLFSVSVTKPTWLMVYLVYIAGMLTGGLVWDFLRKSIHRASQPRL
jgi:uncharacterized integral membrane protein